MDRPLLSPRVVGRDRELAVLRAALAGEHHARSVALIGDAGLGKSALLTAATASAPGFVLTGRAVPDGVPLQPLADLAVAAVVAGADAESAALDGLRAGLGPLLGARSTADPASAAGMTALVGEALLALAATLDGPVTFVIDDLHWADGDTIAVCRRLAERAMSRRLAVLLAARPGSAAEEDLRRQSSSRVVDVLDLGPLRPDDVADMVAGCLGAPAPAALLDALSVCEGRPFFIEEHLRAAHEAGVLVSSAAGWQFAEDVSLPVPGSVIDALRRRAGDLPPTTRRVLSTASVLGEGATLDAIAAAAEVEAADVAVALREGRSAQLLAEDAGRVAFRHALTADALASLVTEPERAALAQRALDQIQAATDGEQATKADAATLARWAELAGDRDDAARWRIEVARRLASHAAVGPALEQYDLALELANEPVHRATARVERVELLVLAGHVEAARREVDAAAALADDDADIRSHLAMLRAQVEAPDPEASRRWTAIAREAAGTGPRLGDVLATSGFLEVERGETTAAEALAREALTIADNEPAARCRALEVLGRVARTRSLDEAARFFRQEAAVAETHDLMLWNARARHELATIRQLRYGDTIELETARAAAVKSGAPGLVGAVDFHIAGVKGAAFDGRGALAAARRCVDLAGVLDDTRGQAWGWMLCALAHLVVGERDAAAAALAASDRLDAGDDELATLSDFLRVGLGVLLEGDPSGAASGYFDAMVRLAERSESVSPLPPWYLGPLLLTVVDHDDAERVRQLADRDELTVVVLCHPTLLLARAVDAGRRGDLDAANRWSEEAFAAWVGKPATDASRHLASWLAAGPAERDGWGDPKRWLFDAEAWAAGQGLDGVASSCRSQLRATGATPRRRRSRTPVPTTLQPYGLTGREVDVLGLLREGLSNAAIGRRLHIAPGTVKGYVENLLVKTGVANRSALALLAVEHGVVAAGAEDG